MYLAIVSWDSDNRASKYASFDTQQEADDHVAQYGGFVVANPPAQPWFLIVDPNNQTVSVAAGPPIEDVGAISRVQFYKQLKAIEKIAQIRALASSWADDSDARIEWEAGVMIEKDGALITAVKAELGLTDAQVTSFFNDASILQRY